MTRTTGGFDAARNARELAGGSAMDVARHSSVETDDSSSSTRILRCDSRTMLITAMGCDGLAWANFSWFINLNTAISKCSFLRVGSFVEFGRVVLPAFLADPVGSLL